MKRSKIKLVSILCAIAMVVTTFSAPITSVFAEEEDVELPALEMWHYRIPIVVDSGDYNRRDCILTQEVNITKEIGGFGTFDGNSVIVIETNETGIPISEVTSQYERLDTNSIAVTWIMNGFTPAHTKRYYSIYFDILEYEPKEAPQYEELVEVEENSEHIWIEGEYFDSEYYGIEEYEIKINKDRGGSREVKINDVPRKGFVYDQTWQSWHSSSLSWNIKGAETTVIEDGPIYKKVKIVSSDKKQILYWYFYPDRMKIIFKGEGNISFDTIADNLLNVKGTLVWDDCLFENLTKDYKEYSSSCTYFYILDTDLRSANDDVKGRCGFWADTIDSETQTIINAGEKGTRWILGGNEAWFGFAKSEVVRGIALRSQNLPKITRERTYVRWIEPKITKDVVISDQNLFVKGNLTVEADGNLILERVHLTINGSVVVVNGTMTLQNSRCEIVSEYNGQQGIYVEQEGEFYVYSSTITANTEYYYKFQLGGKAEIRDSDISKLWANQTAPNIGGIQIYSNDVILSGCDIHDSQGSGIFIPSNYTPTVTNNTISHCKYGIYAEGTNSTCEWHNSITGGNPNNEKTVVNITYDECTEDIEYSDGTHQITYGVGTYWDDEQQKWLPANTTLIPSTLEGYDYMCEKNTFKIYFKLNAQAEELIKIVYNNASMTLSFKESIPNQVVGNVNGSSITYYDIHGHTDITHTLLPRRLKETITIKQKTNITTYSMKISMKNVTYRYTNDSISSILQNNITKSKIEFLGDNNQTLWYMLSPSITD
ncbi:MAG: right-handed parallel beta-helix repeat-containing protein, partial [Candidatus Thermoplasmatota archaeon]